MCPFPLSFAVAILFLLNSCISTLKPVVIQIEKMPEQKARMELAVPFVQNLSDFGNNLAKLMLKDYRLEGVQNTTDGVYLYRFDRINTRLPKHAYLVLRLEGNPSLTTNAAGPHNTILLSGGSFCLVPTDEPAVVNDGSFNIQFTKSGFMEAFNPWCIGKKGTYPNELLLWFKNPTTKDENMRNIASLMLSAFPHLKYGQK